MMRRRQVLVFLAGTAAVWGAGPLAIPGTTAAWAVPTAPGAVSAGRVQAASSWGRAIEVPGLAALNKGGNAQVAAVSCTAARNCAAGGYYRDQHGHDQGFVVSERYGRWGRAIEVPGLGALNRGGSAYVNSVLCTSAGNCVAIGSYTDQHRHGQGFVAGERNGSWWKAIQVPGLAALNKGGSAGVNEVSCTSTGNCVAGGGYVDGHGHGQGFVISERHGRWGQATEVPGLGALNQDGDAYVLSVSCGSAGNCAAVGDYDVGAGTGQGFVASESNGVWGKALEVPGLGALNAGDGADVFSVSCGATGSCVAVGDYTDGGDNGQGFVANERNGIWGKAFDPPGLGALNGSSGGGNAEVDSVSCTSAGNCTAVGTYGEPYGVGFVAIQKNGRWENAMDVPGLDALNGRIASANAVSCVLPGSCAVGGSYSDDTGGIDQGYVAVERYGRWANAIEVPGLGALNKGGGAYVVSVSCGTAGRCTAGGSYTDGRGRSQGFVT